MGHLENLDDLLDVRRIYAPLPQVELLAVELAEVHAEVLLVGAPLDALRPFVPYDSVVGLDIIDVQKAIGRGDGLDMPGVLKLMHDPETQTSGSYLCAGFEASKARHAKK